MQLDLLKFGNDDRRQPSPENVKFADGSPIINLLLNDPNALTLSHEEREEAGVMLHSLVQAHPDVLLSLAGKQTDEARAILQPCIDSMRSAADVREAA